MTTHTRAISAAPLSGRTADPCLLAVEDLEVSVPTSTGWAPAVRGVSLQVAPGEVLGLVGESGSGKSLTAVAIAGLERFSGARVTGGAVELSGVKVVGSQRKVSRDRRIGMVFQNPLNALNPSLSVGEQVAEVFRYHASKPRNAAWTAAVELLGEVGIAAPARRAREFPHHFSGGMLQRVSIAMALAGSPELVLLDEPTTALDVTVQAEIIRLLQRLQVDYAVGMVFISHDLGVIAEVANRVAVMYAGEIVESNSRDNIFSSPQHPYTRALLKAMPVLSAERRTADFIPGSVPGPQDRLVGCRYFTRCIKGIEGRCDVAQIDEMVIADDATVRCIRWSEHD